MPVRFDTKARKLAAQTGLDKLGQSTLAKIDKDGDGVVKLRQVQALVKQAGLDKDGVLGRDDRAKVLAALDAPSSTSTKSTGPSSALAARTSGAKKLVDAYLSPTITAKAGLQIALDATFYDARGAVSGDKARTFTVGGMKPAAADVAFYGTDGKTRTTSSESTADGPLFEGSTAAAGFVVAVADPARGIVLVDVAAKSAVDGAAPAVHDLLSPAALAKDAAVKKAAKAAGLDPKTLRASVVDVGLSIGWEDGKTITLSFDAKLTDASGKSRKRTFSTTLSGDLKKPAAKLQLGDLEQGVESRWGWRYPPSTVLDEPRTRDVDDGGRTRDVGGGESSGGTIDVGGGESSGGGGGGGSIDVGGGE